MKPMAFKLLGFVTLGCKEFHREQPVKSLRLDILRKLETHTFTI